MKKFVLAVVMAMASISVAHAVEIASITSYSVDSNTLSPGLGIGTKIGPVGVGYVFQESQNNGRITHVHVLGLSKDLWQQDKLALGIKGGAAYLIREQKANGWTNMIGPYVSYRLSDDFRIVTDLLFTRGSGDMAETSSTLVQVGFRYKF